MSDEPTQATLSDTDWDTTESTAQSHTQTQHTPPENTNQNHTESEKRTHTHNASERSFTFTRSDLPTASHAVTQQALDSLCANSPAAPLPDAVESLATQNPRSESAAQRRARALFIYGCAQMGAVNGYTLSESMIPLRDCIEAELDIATTELVANDYLRAKRLNGQQKYYRLTTDGRRALAQSPHPPFSLLRPDVDRPIVGDGALHNRGVLLGGEWLLRATATDAVAQPELGTEISCDLGGYVDGDRRWLGESIAAEDLPPENSTSDGHSDTFLNRIQQLKHRPEKSLVVFENSSVAVRALTRLDAEGVLALPPGIDYRKYSIAQLRDRLLAELEHSAFNHIESFATLLEDQ